MTIHATGPASSLEKLLVLRASDDRAITALSWVRWSALVAALLAGFGSIFVSRQGLSERLEIMAGLVFWVGVAVCFFAGHLFVVRQRLALLQDVVLSRLENLSHGVDAS